MVKNKVVFEKFKEKRRKKSSKTSSYGKSVYKPSTFKSWCTKSVSGLIPSFNGIKLIISAYKCRVYNIIWKCTTYNKTFVFLFREKVCYKPAKHKEIPLYIKPKNMVKYRKKENLVYL